jgi:hypothetical protein
VIVSISYYNTKFITAVKSLMVQNPGAITLKLFKALITTEVF